MFKKIRFLFLFGLCMGTCLAENLNYSGKISDAAGAPIPWALIHVEGGTTYTQSDVNGNFTLLESAALALYPEVYPQKMLPQSTEIKKPSEIFLTNGRNIYVTRAAQIHSYQNPRELEVSLDQNHQKSWSLAKVAASYNLIVTKAHFQNGNFAQTLKAATELGLTLGASPTDTATYVAEKKLCIDTINACRKSLGLAAVVWSKSLEAFADEGARYDAGTNTAHDHFSKFSSRAVPADAENAVPAWPLKNYKTVAAIVQKGTAMMWAEGPGGGHYENIRGNQTEVGCGIYVMPSGNVWMIQDFK